jgi:hypothetical protein
VNSNRYPRKFLVLIGAVILSLSATSSVRAFQIDTGNDDLTLRWDTTLKYGAMFRVAKQNPLLINGSNINADDGDRNFSRGLVSNRGDILSEADISYKAGDLGTFGGRVSGAAWYDRSYNTSTDYNGLASGFNPTSVPPGEFPNGTRMIMGRDAELLDGFVFGSGNIGDGGGWSIRAGRHTVLWGESLIFAGNGVAAGQAPIDAAKATSSPGILAKELYMPVNQVSATFAPFRKLNLMAYYQLEWRRTRVPGAGSYFSSADMLDNGGERIIGVGPRGADITPSNSGQYGVGLMTRSDYLETDFGVYYVKFDAKAPNLYTHVGGTGTFQWVFPEDIHIFAVSAAKNVEGLSLATELGLRTHQPLKAGSINTTDPTADNDKNPKYPIGKTFHAQVNGIYLMNPTLGFDTISISFEVAGHRKLSIEKNPTAFEPQRSRDYAGGTVNVEPSLFKVGPSLDLTFPMSLNYNFLGKSPIDTPNVVGTGSFSVGITGKYSRVWVTTLKYTNFYGSATDTLPNGRQSNYQASTDRDNISFLITRSI